MPDDPRIPPAMRVVRDLSPEEYDATYASGEPHHLPDDLLAHLEEVARGEVRDQDLKARFSAAAPAAGDLALPYLPAAAHGGALPVPTRIRVVHCTEGPMSRGNARALAGPAWFGGPKAGTSAHVIFDPGEGIEMVKPGTVAYHVGPGGNGKTRGTEHCGRVAFTRAQWLSDDGMDMLTRSARYEAAAAKRDGVLPRWLTLTQLRNLEPGFCTHNDVRLALGGTTHSDPGPNFPYDVYMDLVQGFYNGTQEDDMPLSDADVEKVASAVVRKLGAGAGYATHTDIVTVLRGATEPNSLAKLGESIGKIKAAVVPAEPTPEA